jgi:hypothetical protein
LHEAAAAETGEKCQNASRLPQLIETAAFQGRAQPIITQPAAKAAKIRAVGKFRANSLMRKAKI